MAAAIEAWVRHLGSLEYAFMTSSSARRTHRNTRAVHAPGVVLAAALVGFARSRNNEARRLFSKALPLYREVGDKLGEANIPRNLGELEFLESRNDDARRLFDEALPLCREVRSLYPMAVCTAWLAAAALTEQQRIELCESACSLAERVGVAHLVPALRSLGRCAWRAAACGQRRRAQYRSVRSHSRPVHSQTWESARRFDSVRSG